MMIEDMGIIPVVHLAVAVINLAIGGYVLFKNFRSPTNRSFFVFAVGVVGWIGGMSLFFETQQFFFAIVSFWGSALIVLGLALFAEYFPEGRSKTDYFPLTLIPWLIVFALIPSPLFIQSAKVNARGYLEPVHGPLFPLWGIMVGAYLAWSFWKMYRKHRGLYGIHRVQLKYVIAGAGTFLCIGFISNVLLSAFGIYQFNFIGPLASVVFLGCIAYAIVRHQFMDIRIVIKRGIVYALTLAVVGVLFFGLEFLIEKFYYNDEVADIFSAMVGALVFWRLKEFFEKITDPFFFRGEYDYAGVVRELGTLLDSTTDPDELLAILAAFLGRTVKPDHIVFFLADPDRLVSFGDTPLTGNYEQFVRMHAHDRGIVLVQEMEGAAAALPRALRIGAVVPFASKGKAIAIMFIGEKRSGDIYRRKDIDLLHVIAFQASMALDNAQYYAMVRRDNEELERKVAERTERVRVMHEEQSRFFSEISHELQTPIAIMKGNLEILKSNKRGAKKDALWVMDATMERMARHVENLLAVARLNFSKEQLQRTEVRVDALLEEVCGDCLILAEHKGVALSSECDGSAVAGDRDKLRDVIMNLVSNALKHTFAGGSIVLRGERVGDTVHISVTDTGAGIDPEDLPHIFERFYRVGRGSAPGSGLGLHICRKIVEAHNGTIAAASEPGKGSCFTVTLPVFVRESVFEKVPSGQVSRGGGLLT